MVRYELILHRYPKLSVADIPKRMGDLPEEFSEGTLQRALENPDGGTVAIAWGDRRKRLLMIKRRIEILGGSAELIDRAGPLAKKLTEIGDNLRELLPKKPEGTEERRYRDPTELSFMWIGIALAACAAGLVYSQLAQDAHQRTYSVQAAGFALSVIMSQLFVRGVRRWFAEEGRASVSALLVLLPMLALFGAGYEAYALGTVKRSAALISGETKTASAKPLMKPFAALIVELRHRKQRQELAAALAGESERGAHGDKPKPAAPAEVEAAAPEAASPEESEASAEAAPHAAPARHAKPGHKRKTAMTTAQATPVDSPQLTAAGVAPPIDTPEAAMARWVGDVGQATPTELLAAPAREAAPQPRAQESVHKPLPAPAPAQIDERWDPLRRIDDVNEIHVAVAVAFAALMFVIGLWSGRRTRKRVPAAVPAQDAPQPEPEAPTIPEPHPAFQSRDPFDQPAEAEADPWAEPAHATAPPEHEERHVPAAVMRATYGETSFDDLTSPGISPTDDPLALPDAFEDSLPPATPSRREPDALPSLPPPILAQAKPKPAPQLEDTNQWPEWPAEEPAPVQAPVANDNAAVRPAPQKPARKRAAGTPRGGIQEEMVVRRRSDARRDD